MSRMWCKVTKIGGRVVIGFTAADEKVLMSNKGDRLTGVQPGDIISFVPHTPADRNPNPFDTPPKWFGGDPHIIARRIVGDRPVARPRSNAVVWKQEQETRADADAFSEAFK